MDHKVLELIAGVVAEYALDKVVTAGGEKVLEKGKELCSRVLGWLRGRPGGELVVRRVEEDADYAPALVLKELVKGLPSDPAFADQLLRLVVEYRKIAEQQGVNLASLSGGGTLVQGNNNTVAGQGGIAIGGTVTGSVVATGPCGASDVGERKR